MRETAVPLRVAYGRLWLRTLVGSICESAAESRFAGYCYGLDLREGTTVNTVDLYFAQSRAKRINYWAAHMSITRRGGLTYMIIVATAAIYVLIIMVASLSSMSALQRLGLTATIVGPIALILTVYFVTKQLRDSAETRQASLFDSTAGRMLDLDRIFIENPSTRPYLYENGDFSHLSPDDRSQILAIAELHVDFFDTELLRRKTFPTVLKGLPGFEPWIRGVIKTSPAVCKILIDDRARAEEDRWYDAIHDIYEECINRGEAALRPATASRDL